ncbi:MAG: CoA transferase [Acidimicrobiales bacterium]
MSGPLQGVTVVELASEWTAFAGKLLVDLGAEVIVVEPLGGSALRRYPPFVEDHPDPDASLWWWHYQAAKTAMVADVGTAAGAATVAARLAEGTVDVVLEAEAPGALAAVGLSEAELRATLPALLWLTISSHGSEDPRSLGPSTDLTLLAEAGPVWSCGYDDHAVAPVRGGGGQAANTAAHYAVMTLLVALLSRERTGRGQRIDVNAYAASNVTTEFATYGWLAAGDTVQRQTGRHAMFAPTKPTQVQAADGRWVNTGPPRRGADFVQLVRWIEELGLAEEFDEMGVLRLGVDLEHIGLAQMEEDSLVGEIFQAGREAQFFIASRLPAYDFFLGTQQRGMPVGIVYSPEEVAADPHFVARGWPRPVDYPQLGRTIVHPGPPIRFPATPAEPLTPAPRLP